MRAQLLCHILAYAEMLLAWQLPEKRAELLKMVEDDIQCLDPEPVIMNETLYAAPMGMYQSQHAVFDSATHVLAGLLQPCEYCGHLGDPCIPRCPECRNRRPARCAVCRLAIKGTCISSWATEYADLARCRTISRLCKMLTCFSHEVLESTRRPVLCERLRLHLCIACS